MKLDLGCGRTPKKGFLGVDKIKFPEVEFVCDISKERWPWEDETVDEAHCSHMVEHLKPDERIHFVNELYRVLKPKGKAVIITPHWASERAYGDLTHEWPPVSPFWYNYLNKKFREHTQHEGRYTCDFVADIKGAMNPKFDKMQAPLFVNGVDDLVVTVTKNGSNS